MNYDQHRYKLDTDELNAPEHTGNNFTFIQIYIYHFVLIFVAMSTNFLESKEVLCYFNHLHKSAIIFGVSMKGAFWHEVEFSTHLILGARSV